MVFFNTQSKKRPLLRLPALAAFVHPAQHGFCFASFLKHFSVFEKSAGSGFSRQPRRGLAQGGVKQKWRYIPIPRRAGIPSAVPYREVVMPREAGTPGAAVAQGGARAATAG